MIDLYRFIGGVLSGRNGQCWILLLLDPIPDSKQTNGFLREAAVYVHITIYYISVRFDIFYLSYLRVYYVGEKGE